MNTHLLALTVTAVSGALGACGGVSYHGREGGGFHTPPRRAASWVDCSRLSRHKRVPTIPLARFHDAYTSVSHGVAVNLFCLPKQMIPSLRVLLFIF